MRSRKSGAGEGSQNAIDFRRTPLRRLSSIASLHNLLNRRRSNNVVDATAGSSSSNLSLSSTTAVAPGFLRSGAATVSDLQHDKSLLQPQQMPPRSQILTKQSGYVCLPDDPIGGMPRSRTFSNLPLPTRARKATPLMPPNPHTRLPSDVLPSTRLPSPPMTTRKHSHTTLMSTDNVPHPAMRTRVARSGTEPLFKVDMDQGRNLPRTTAFKENISLSPIKQLPTPSQWADHSFCASSPSAHFNGGKEWWIDTADVHQPLLQPEAAMPPRSGYVKEKAVQKVRQRKPSPACRDSKDKMPSLRASARPDMQRWSSQPVLANLTNRRNSQHGEIKQTRLMSTCQPPTPPPPRTPLSSQQFPANKPNCGNSSSRNLVEAWAKTPMKSSRSPPKHHVPVSKVSLLEVPDTLPSRYWGLLIKLKVTRAEPSAYWCGRLSALIDRYRNEEFSVHANGNRSKQETDKMHNAEATTNRLRRAFEYLHSHCVTMEARESLVAFHRQYVRVMKILDLSPSLVLKPPKQQPAQHNDRPTTQGATTSEMRKVSFMDRLLGRQKRRSLVLAST